MKNLFNRFVREEQGQDLIEYALLAGLISLASVLAITAVGTALRASSPGRRFGRLPHRSSEQKSEHDESVQSLRS